MIDRQAAALSSLDMRSDTAPAAAFDVVTAGWGADYINLFLDLGILNQLSPGNLPALPPGSRYRIFTAAVDLPQLMSSARLDEVRQVLPVDLVAVNMSDADRQTRPRTVANAHKRMIACHRRAASDAAEQGRGMIFLSPDLVLTEGAMATLLRRHAEGARAVLCTALRLSLEGFTAAQSSGGPVALAPRALVRQALPHLHPATLSLMIDGGSNYRTAAYWPVRPGAGAPLEGVLIRTFTLHPLLVDPVRRTELPGGPIDSHYVRHCVPDLRQVHVIDDSDELAVFELTSTGRTIGSDSAAAGGAAPSWRVLVARLVAGAARWDSHQVAHWQRPIRLHAGELDTQWAAADAESSRLANAVERYRPYAPALVVMYRVLKFCRRREDAYRTSARKFGRRSARSVRVMGQRIQTVAQLSRKALRPPVTGKQIARPVRLAWHRVAKAWKLKRKQMGRRIRLSRAT